MSASDLPEPTIDQARQLGEKGSPARESERLLFEAWMGGHCWVIGGTWTGTQYKASDEDGLRVNQQAMLTRMLWAAWRDRGTLADDQLRAYGDKRAREAVPEGWKLVPVEPTETMAAAFADQLEGACGSFFEWERGGDEGYAAMLASAPTPGEKT